jgi:ABC-type multidrug transport system fused ATPase/permease subunit
VLRNIRKILQLLEPRERARSYVLLAMVLVMALLDTIGVGSVLPFVAVLSDPEAVSRNRYLAAVYAYAGFADTRAFLRFLGLIVFGALIASVAFRALTTYVLLQFTNMRSYSLSKRLVAGYLRQPYEWFLERHSADLGKTVLAEVNEVVTRALVPMVQTIAHGTVVIFLVTLLVIVDPVLALALSMAFGGFYVCIYFLLRRYLTRIGLSRLESNRARYQLLQETFAGIKHLKVAGLEDTMIDRFDKPARRLARRQAAYQIVSQLPRFALEAIAFGGVLLAAMYLMSEPGRLQKALPVLAIYALAGYRLLPALQQVYAHVTNLRFAGPTLDRLHADLTELQPSGIQGTVARRPLQLRQELILEDISYRYPRSERPVLDRLSLRIPAGTTVGLVGATGSGKTTTVDVILGLLRPHEGRVLLDSIAITDENVRDWQRMIGYVPQSVYLSDESIAANIAFGQPQEQIDLAAVERAARIAHLHEFVTGQLPQGYETKVGDRGIRLSGGQSQRIGIARALYHDPEVLILDEATSALDTVTESSVMDAVHDLGRRKTIIIIAHRLTTVRRCDRIFVLEFGKVVEQGTFDQLLKTDLRFKAMIAGGGGVR